MESVSSAAGILAALLGHFSITVWLFNRLHALGWPRPIVKSLEKVLVLVAVSSFFAAAVWMAVSRRDSAMSLYLGVTWAAAVIDVPLWLIPKLLARAPGALVSNDTTLVDVAARAGFSPLYGAETFFFAGVPGNQILSIAVQRKTIELARLPAELDGLTIAHLSDLHMTGQLGREFYDVVMAETNALAPDLIVITGDIVEREGCLAWIEPTLGGLVARYGKFFILGNHEQRLADVLPLRQMLGKIGIENLGSQWKLVGIRGQQILLAGTELPWFGSAPVIPADARDQAAFSILLSHTPDQIAWARKQGFDLVLAGHTHGGQIRLPWLGALVAPSFYGTRYAGGLFDEPPTLMHVSRGLAGIHPIRLNCRPELTLLTLRAAGNR